MPMPCGGASATSTRCRSGIPASPTAASRTGSPPTRWAACATSTRATGAASASGCWRCPTTNTAAPTRSWKARWAWRTTPPRSSSRRSRTAAAPSRSGVRNSTASRDASRSCPTTSAARCSRAASTRSSATSARGAEDMLQKVVRSAVIDAPIARVWQVLRDFNSHAAWHDVVEASRIEHGEPSSRVGCVRSFTLKDGGRIREQLLALSDSEHRSTYCMLDATVPLKRYVATVTLKPVTDGDRTFWHWESRFEAPPGREAEMRRMVAEDVYEAGFANMRHYLSGGADGRGAHAAVTGADLAGREVRLARYGGPEELEIVNAVAAPPGPGEVRIRQSAVGVNFLDIYLRRGWMPGLLPLPGVLGMEAAGTVADIGTGVAGLLPGDRVAYLCPQPGAYRS